MCLHNPDINLLRVMMHVTSVCLLLQASTYEIEEVDEDTHEMLGYLCNVSTDDNEYDAMKEVLRHMLHPDASARGSVSQALQSSLFAGC